MLRGSDVGVFMPSVLSTASCIVESLIALTNDDLMIKKIKVGPTKYGKLLTRDYLIIVVSLLLI